MLAWSTVIAKANTDQADPEKVKAGVELYLTHYQSLLNGHLTEEGFLIMVQFLYLSDHVARTLLMSLKGNDVGTKQITDVGMEVILPARDALDEIGVRYGDIGRYVAKGDEARVLHELALRAEEMMMLCNIGQLHEADLWGFKTLSDGLNQGRHNAQTRKNRPKQRRSKSRR